MKRIYTYLNVFCAAAVALLLVSCGGGNDYRNLIPADAITVFSVNPKSIAHKAQVGDFTQSVIYKQIDRMLGEDDITPERRAYILSLIAEPSKTGLSMDHDCFWFVSGQNIQYGDFMTGMVFKVKDRKALDKLADFVIEDSDMGRYAEGDITIITDQDGWSTEVLAYNGDACMIFFASGEYGENLPVIKRLFEQKKAESIMSSQHLASTFNGSYDMSMAMSYRSLMPMIKQQLGMAMPGIDFIGKMSVVMPVNFEKGRIVSDAKVYFDDKDAEKQYEEMSKANRVLQGDLMKYLPANSVAVFGGGISGAKTYELLQSMPMFSMAMAMVPQVKAIFEGIEGDIVLSFNKMSTNGKYPEATLMAEAANAEVLETIRGLIATMLPMKQVSEGAYEGNLMGVPFWFGLKDKMLYASTDPCFAALLGGAGGASLNDKYGKLYKGNYGMFVIDCVALRDMLEVLIANRVIDDEVGMALPFIGIFEDMQFHGSSLNDAKMEVNMTDKGKNAADVLYHTIESAIGMFMGMAF